MLGRTVRLLAGGYFGENVKSGLDIQLRDRTIAAVAELEHKAGYRGSRLASGNGRGKGLGDRLGRGVMAAGILSLHRAIAARRAVGLLGRTGRLGRGSCGNGLGRRSGGLGGRRNGNVDDRNRSVNGGSGRDDRSGLGCFDRNSDGGQEGDAKFGGLESGTGIPVGQSCESRAESITGIGNQLLVPYFRCCGIGDRGCSRAGGGCFSAVAARLGSFLASGAVDALRVAVAAVDTRTGHGGHRGGRNLGTGNRGRGDHTAAADFRPEPPYSGTLRAKPEAVSLDLGLELLAPFGCVLDIGTNSGNRGRCGDGERTALAVDDLEPVLHDQVIRRTATVGGIGHGAVQGGEDGGRHGGPFRVAADSAPRNTRGGEADWQRSGQLQPTSAAEA